MPQITRIAIPQQSALLLSSAAFLLLGGFITSRILSTVPEPNLHVASATAHVVSTQQYAGVVSWVSDDSIAITDQFGTSRLFTLNANTLIENNIERKMETLSQIRVFKHIRVTSETDGDTAIATHIIDMQ